MGFWQWLTAVGATPNSTVGDPPTVGPDYTPGDPDGVEIVTPEPGVQTRMAAVVPSGWDGLPAGWAPQWSGASSRLEELVDTAWAALDLNASVLSAMPVYRVRDTQVLPPTAWMTNPDPSVYASWPEFAKQLFWDFQLGEAFVLPMARGADGFPYNFRVIPPWLVNVEMDGGTRSYKLGTLDITSDVLHIRYKSTTDSARGVGPLEVGRYRLIAAGVLMKYASEVAEGGWIPKYVLETEQRMNREQSMDLLDQWWESRLHNLGERWKPAVLSGGVKAHTLQLTPEQMELVDLAKFNEARICTLLGIPPFLLGLPQGESMTYSNVSQVFDFHHRRYLNTAAVHVMSALSNWVLPRGQSAELNHDSYSQPALLERATAYEKLINLGVLSPEQVRVMERFRGPTGTGGPSGDMTAAEALTGGGRS